MSLSVLAVPARCPTGESKKTGSVTKVVTIEKLLDDQLPVNH
jgi:hypothetical protein